MELSKFSIIVNDHPNKDEHLLYHTRTQALVKVNNELLSLFSAPNKNNNDLIEKYSADLKSMHEMGLLVTDTAEDQNRCEDFFKQIKNENSSRCFHMTILTTMACNFDCVYCFEKNATTKQNMKIVTCEKLIEWIKTQPLSDYDEIYITFYGGEPLLNTLAIDYITTYLKIISNSLNLRFRFCLQTNGYLLEEETINHYIALGLDQIQISLDGIAEDHDKTRPLKSGGKTFGKIFRNIETFIDKVNIGISSSYQDGDITHIKKLISYFEEKNMLDKLSRFVFSPIHSILNKHGKPQKFKKNECSYQCQEDHLIEAAQQIQDLMNEKNLPTRSGLAINMCCLLREKGSITIDPEGRIYKCNSLIGHPQFSVGSIFEDDFNAMNQEFLNLDVWKKCPPDCAYLPMCGGGCQLFSYLTHETFGKQNCQKKYLDTMVPTFIKNEYNKFISQQ